MILKANKAAYLKLSHFEDFDTNTVLVSYKEQFSFSRQKLRKVSI